MTSLVDGPFRSSISLLDTFLFVLHNGALQAPLMHGYLVSHQETRYKYN